MDDPFGLNTLAGAGCMIHLFGPLNGRKISTQDIAAWAQIGMCICEDKPLILMCPPGSVVPDNHPLRKVARHIIEMDTGGAWQVNFADALLDCGMSTEQLHNWTKRQN
jgi:hypothetical protein